VASRTTPARPEARSRGVYRVESIDTGGRQRIASVRIAGSAEEAIADYLAEAKTVEGRTYQARCVGQLPGDER